MWIWSACSGVARAVGWRQKKRTDWGKEAKSRDVRGTRGFAFLVVGVVQKGHSWIG
jgi:hypothetical protein